MLSVFLSYSGNTSTTAAGIHAALTGLGAKVLSYKHPNAETPINATAQERIQKECESAHMFIQVVDEDLGCSEIGGIPILQCELQWFLESMHTDFMRKPKPLILTVGALNELTSSYVRSFDASSEVIHCDKPERSIEIATSWYSKLRVVERDPRVIQGHMDLEIGQPLVDKALGHALHHDELVPQKLLYTSPFGALFWRKLANDPSSSVRRLYNAIDFDSDNVEPVSKTISEISQWDPRIPICLIALGCGDGRREAILTEHLIRRFPGRPFRVLLVDISKTLVAMAARRFMTIHHTKPVDLAINFALADFEHPITLSNLMSQWQPDYPVVVLFLGNTLGNINFSSFIASVSSAMTPNDVLLTEITMAPGPGARPNEEVGKWTRISPQHDDRFNFLTGPVRELGVRPQLKNFRVRVDKEEHCVRKTYGYHLDESESAAVESILNHKHITGRRLLLLRVDAFYEEPLRKELSKTLNLIGNQIHKFPVKDLQGQEMGLFLAKRQ